MKSSCRSFRNDSNTNIQGEQMSNTRGPLRSYGSQGPRNINL